MKTIILDTNFLTIPYQFGVDIFEEIGKVITGNYELITLEGVVKELGQMSQEKGKDSVAAKIGLELIKKKGVKVVKTQEKNVDDAILELASEQTLVATNDKKLIKSLKHKNVKVLYLRSKNRLVLE
ncbi:MAG: nucleotide-binding protein [Candidatus Aenigmarchaeota archaeon]|nr:nucleotide-binding protein [Candidatus Aenigmarchaeota archaeon]